MPPYTPLRDAASTLEKQRESGYYAEAGAPYVPPHTPLRDAASTLERQSKSGYYPDAGAPYVNTTIR